MPLIELRNVNKRYEAGSAAVWALQEISLAIEAGDFVALVGRSGCGKSTLLNLCGAMDFPTSGEVILDGQVTGVLSDAALSRIRRDKVGFIFQSFQLLNTLTAVENVELPLMLARKKDARPAALKSLEWVEIGDWAHRYPHQLSGGQQQRVAIARALVHRPRLILADEPTGNLDSTTGEVILKLLGRITNNFETAVIMATHSPEAAALATRIIRMRDGRIESAA